MIAKASTCLIYITERLLEFDNVTTYIHILLMSKEFELEIPMTRLSLLSFYKEFIMILKQFLEKWNEIELIFVIKDIKIPISYCL